MEKHKCKLCFRNFSNGRALGGHMRSHMVNLPVPPKQAEERPLIQLSFEAESASSSSSSSSDEDEDDDDKGLSYGLRENPKRSIRVVDPEFAFAVVESASVSVIPQDRESETESSKNPTRRRSKRPLNQYDHNHLHQNHYHHRHHHHHKKHKSTNKIISIRNNNYNAEPEQVSSISDATTEEDVAFCLMMLSRDKWKRQKDPDEDEEEDDEHNDEEEDDDDDDEEEKSLEDSDEFSEDLKSSTKTTTRSVCGKYKCETCKKVFRSYQALGGHRASHKKMKVPLAAAATATNTASYEPELEQEKKIHECPVCFRVFASGQALGGHKRTHVTGSSSTSIRTSATKFAENNFIDLNLPAPIDDDDVSQIENSAVSDAEFLKAQVA